MKGLIMSIIFIISFGLIFSLAFAEGNVERGKALFNDPKLGGASAGISCNSCHPNGKGLEEAADNKNLEALINSCIENANKGKAIDPKSEDMANLVAYIKSLKGKTSGPGEEK